MTDFSVHSCCRKTVSKSLWCGQFINVYAKKISGFLFIRLLQAWAIFSSELGGTKGVNSMLTQKIDSCQISNVQSLSVQPLKEKCELKLMIWSGMLKYFISDQERQNSWLLDLIMPSKNPKRLTCLVSPMPEYARLVVVENFLKKGRTKSESE